MTKTIEFAKGGNKGSITLLADGTFLAVIASASKSYKTERGARNFMARNGYEEVEKVLDLNTINTTDMAELEKIVSNFDAMPENVKNFILNECDSFYFFYDSIILYKGRTAVAEGSFYLVNNNNKIEIQSLGAGDVFQWNKWQTVEEPAAEPVEAEAEVMAEDQKAALEKKIIFFKKPVAKSVSMVYNNKCSKEQNKKQNDLKERLIMKKYNLHLEAMETEVKVGKMVRVDLFNGTTLAEVEELKGFKFEVKDGHVEAACEVVYLMVTGIDAKAKIEFSKYVNEDVFTEEKQRSLDVYVTVTGENANNVHDMIAEIMNEYVDAEFFRCPDHEDNYYCDGFTVPYTHGLMSELKKDVKYAFKMAKKQLGLR